MIFLASLGVKCFSLLFADSTFSKIPFSEFYANDLFLLSSFLSLLFTNFLISESTNFLSLSFSDLMVSKIPYSVV